MISMLSRVPWKTFSATQPDMKYHLLPEESIRLGEYSLVTIRHMDMQAIRRWRNDQIEYLRQRFPLSETQQERYWEQQVFPSFQQVQPPHILFSFLRGKHCIGYGGLVHIDWCARRAEVSFLLETSRSENALTFQNEFSLYLKLLCPLAFRHLKLHRLQTETYDLRPLVLKVLEQVGFQQEGRLREHVNLNPDEKSEPRYVDSVLHALLAPDYERQAKK